MLTPDLVMGLFDYLITSLYILVTLWWEGGGPLPVFINKNTPPMEGNIPGGV